MISVVIPCQEDGSLLLPTLKSIFLNKFLAKDFEVLLLHSRHVLISKVAKQFKTRQYSDDFKNGAQALNFGLRKACGEIIAITKPGCVIDPDWLEQIQDFFIANPLIVGVGGPVLPYKKNGTKIQKSASEIFYKEQHFPNTVVSPSLSSYQGVFHATNSAFRKKVLESTKFDESFTYNYDFDMCWKLLRKGYRLVHNPNMKVRYIFPPHLNSLIRRYYTWGRESTELKKRYFGRVGVREIVSSCYSVIRSFLSLSPLDFTSKLLRLTQNVAFNLGRIHALQRS